jgi:hypothetical protein
MIDISKFDPELYAAIDADDPSQRSRRSIRQGQSCNHSFPIT